jgi:hypothetical protein
MVKTESRVRNLGKLRHLTGSEEGEAVSKRIACWRTWRTQGEPVRDGGIIGQLRMMVTPTIISNFRGSRSAWQSERSDAGNHTR